jgi:cytochrome c oxidase cbb3-type subunit 4
MNQVQHMGISSGTISGIVTAVLILLFLGVVGWAWSTRRRATYEAAARLPLEEDGDQP